MFCRVVIGLGLLGAPSVSSESDATASLRAPVPKVTENQQMDSDRQKLLRAATSRIETELIEIVGQVGCIKDAANPTEYRNSLLQRIEKLQSFAKAHEGVLYRRKIGNEFKIVAPLKSIATELSPIVDLLKSAKDDAAVQRACLKLWGRPDNTVLQEAPTHESAKLLNPRSDLVFAERALSGLGSAVVRCGNVLSRISNEDLKDEQIRLKHLRNFKNERETIEVLSRRSELVSSSADVKVIAGVLLDLDTFYRDLESLFSNPDVRSDQFAGVERKAVGLGERLRDLQP